MSAKTARPRPIAKLLAARLADSLLPGDVPFADEGFERATDFVLAAAGQRIDGEPAFALESVSGSAAERFMRIAVINDDMPFLVDSIAAAVASQGLAIGRLVHPVIPVRRDADGKLTAILEDDNASGEKRESMVYLETERGDARARRQLENALRSALGDVRAAVRDWPRMQAAMAADADRLAEAERLADGEGAALLRWFKEGMLTQLGHVLRRRDGSQSEAMGRMGRTWILDTTGADEPALVPPAVFLTLIENGFTHQRVTHGAAVFVLHMERSADGAAHGTTRYTFVSPGGVQSDAGRPVGGTGLRYVKARLEESFPGCWSLRGEPVAEGWRTVIEVRDRAEGGRT